MTAAERKLRESMTALSEDLIALAERAIRESVQLALASLKVPANSPVSSRATNPEVNSPRKRGHRPSAIERLEREQARRQQKREEKRAAAQDRQLSLLERMVQSDSIAGGHANSLRTESESHEEENRTSEPAVVTPPPLFVHKRRRDGAIEALSRSTPNGTSTEATVSV